MSRLIIIKKHVQINTLLRLAAAILTDTHILSVTLWLHSNTKSKKSYSCHMTGPVVVV